MGLPVSLGSRIWAVVWVPGQRLHSMGAGYAFTLRIMGYNFRMTGYHSPLLAIVRIF